MEDQYNGETVFNEKPAPLFSIIIPVYNAASYLGECLESVVGQLFADWEAILVDDGSSDGSVEIAQRFSEADPRVKVFVSQRNSGSAYRPRMRATSLARGKYIVTIDADDKVSADLLQELARCMILNEVDLVIPEMWRIDGSKCFKILPLESVDVSKVWNGRELVALTLRDWSIPMCGFAIRRDLYAEADRHLSEEDKRSIFADELLSRWILFLCRKVVFCDARYFYRNNDLSVTNVNMPRFIDNRMLTSDSLIAMTSAAFGIGSPTYILALENKLYTAVGLLRLINRSGFDKRLRRKSVRRIAEAMKGFDMSALRGKTSPRYLALMRLPASLAAVALKIIDLIKSEGYGVR